jgi:hypothetical protein
VVFDEPSSEVSVSVRQLAGKFVEAADAGDEAAVGNGDARGRKRRLFARS